MFLKTLSKRAALIAVAVPAILAALFVIRMPLSWTDQALFASLLIVVCIAVGRISDSRLVTSALTIVSVYCSLRYIVWRWSASFQYLHHSGWHVEIAGLIFALALLVAESYSVLVLLLGFFQSARSLRRKPVPMPEDIRTWPTVDVFIPTYNEPLEVVRPTVLAAMGIDWPEDRMKVYILDDGRRPEFREFAEECGCGYLIRGDNKHAKAGNINAALKVTSGEYIAIFDCDHIATRSFLQLTMGWFEKDRKLALVQTPHHFYSPDPFERNLNLFRKIPNEGALFYGVVQDGNDLWNATFFCGSCAVIKRDALEQIGGIAVETVTEDAHTALRLQRLGWNTAYIGIPQAAGLATGSLSAHVGQRIRWARGMVQILRTELPILASGLSFAQRLCYLNCAMHYLYAIPRLVFVSAPLVYLLFGTSNLYGFIWEILAYAVPHLVLSNMVNSRCQGNHRHSFWNEVYEMVLAPYILLPTTFALINPKWGKFNVTAKSSVVDQSYFDWQIARPYLFLLLLNAVGIACAIPRYLAASDASGVLAVNVVWACLNMLMLGACIAVSFESKQQRAVARVEADLTGTLAITGEEDRHCRVIDISEGGVAMRAESTLQLAPGQMGAVMIRAGVDQYRFEVETVRTHENRVHLRFTSNGLRHQREITKLVYARADSWINWNKDQRRDRILNSLFHVFSVGAHGIWILPSLCIKQERRAADKSSSSAKKLVLPNTVLPMLALLSLGLFCSTARAQSQFRDRQDLSELGAKSALVLDNEHPAATLNFVLPGTKIVSAAELSLVVHANESATDATELHVSLNGVEATAFAPHKGSQPNVVILPADLLVHDNNLRFELKGSAGLSQNIGSVRIEPSSELQTSGMILSQPNRLSLLPAPFFDASLQRTAELAIVLDSQPDMPALKAAGVMASWFGSLAAHRGTHFAVSQGKFPKGNAIVIARADSSLLTDLHLTPGIEVAICDNPADPYGKILALVAGDSRVLPDLAAAVTRGRFNDDLDHIQVDAAMLATQKPERMAQPNWFDPSKPIQLTKNNPEGMLHTRFGEPANLYFHLPPDLEYGTKLNVPLRLKFKLSGLGSDDHFWLNVRLNQTFVAKRRLGPRDGGHAEYQSFAIPVSLLYSSNTLELNLSSDRDEPIINPQSVDLQILPDTTLDLGDPVHYVRMPRLDLFAASGFPFTSHPDLSHTAIVLASYPTASQIALYLDSIGFLSAQAGVATSSFALLRPSELTNSLDSDILVIADPADGEPTRLFERGMAVLAINGKFEARHLDLPWQEVVSRTAPARGSEERRVRELLDRETSIQFMMEQFASPFRANRSVLVVAGRGQVEGEPLFERLAKASREGAVRGGLLLADRDHVQSFDLTWHTYTLGSRGSIAAVYGSLRFYLWVLPLMVLGGALLLARWWEAVLERQCEKRLGSAN